jgi:hypothetical protein
MISTKINSNLARKKEQYLRSVQRVSSSRWTDGVRRRTTIDEDFYNSIVTTATATSKNKCSNYDDDDENSDTDTDTDTDTDNVQPTTIIVEGKMNHHVAAGARADDSISASASSVTISPFMKLITMASILLHLDYLQQSSHS